MEKTVLLNTHFLNILKGSHNECGLSPNVDLAPANRG